MLATGSPGSRVAADAGVLTLDAVLRARQRMRGVLPPVPLAHSAGLSKLCGCEVYIKPECFLPTRSFKLRGAFNRVHRLVTEHAVSHVVAASAGNHGQGVAWAARRHGIAATVVVPETANPAKVEAMRALGAEVRGIGATFEEAHQAALGLAADDTVGFVEAFDDLDVIAGQATVGLEVAEDGPDLDELVVPVGGGGLVAGVAACLHALGMGTRVVGVQPEKAPSMARSLAAGSIQAVTAHTCADGLATSRPGRLPFAIASRFVERVVLVSEDELIDGVRTVLHLERILTEPAGAASVAALVHRLHPRPGSRVGVILSGGNPAPDVLRRILDDEASGRGE